MIRGTCHCGTVTFKTEHTPAWLTRCNCSFCRRTGALWVHVEVRDAVLTYPPGATLTYVWGDKTLAFHTCRICGATTHWMPLDARPDARMGLNALMAKPEAIAAFRVRTFDGADTWDFLD